MNWTSELVQGFTFHSVISQAFSREPKVKLQQEKLYNHRIITTFQIVSDKSSLWLEQSTLNIQTLKWPKKKLMLVYDPCLNVNCVHSSCFWKDFQVLKWLKYPLIHRKAMQLNIFLSCLICFCYLCNWTLGHFVWIGYSNKIKLK